VDALQFPLHSRVSPDAALHVGPMALHPFAVGNRTNTYVYQEKSGAVFYLRLFYSNLRSGERTRNTKGAATADDADAGVGGGDDSVLCLDVHGIADPGEEITVQLPKMLLAKLDSLTLMKISQRLTRNPQFRLKVTDHTFVRPLQSAPARSLCFPLGLVDPHVGADCPTDEGERREKSEKSEKINPG
jgi:hypothetical protein